MNTYSVEYKVGDLVERKVVNGHYVRHEDVVVQVMRQNDVGFNFVAFMTTVYNLVSIEEIARGD